MTGPAESPVTDLQLAVADAFQSGLSIVPPKEDGSKRPLGRWKRFQTERADRDQVRKWYREEHRSGLGIICGEVSGGVEMLELEGRAVAAGLVDHLLELADASGLGEVLDRVRAGYTETTPSGGIHWLYRVDTPRGNTELARRPSTPDELAINPDNAAQVLIETRGEGGYVVVAPSNGRVHPSGGRWQRVNGSFAGMATISAEERDSLFRLCETFDAMPSRAPVRTPTILDGPDDRPGTLYNARSDAQDATRALLERHGWTHVYSRGDVDYLRRPGKDIGVSATLGYAAPGALYVFTSSSEHFEGSRGYTPFTVYAILEHGGDQAAAARSLVEPSGPLIIDRQLSTETRTDDYAGEEVLGTATDPWPSPPDDAAYHGILGDLALEIAPHTEADPIGIMGTLLAMFGAACGNARTFYQGSLQRPNLSVLLVGETGSRGRKGTSLDVARSIFRLAYPRLEHLWLVGVASGEAVTGHYARLADQAAADAKADPSKTTIPDPRILLVEPEFGRLLTIMNREGSTVSAILRNAWDGVPLGHARARDESLITNHHVAMLGHITPVELRTKLTDADAANGFANRILFVAVRRTQLVPFPTDPDVIVRSMVDPIRWAIDEARKPLGLAMTPAARDRWTAFYADLGERPRLGLAGAVTGRHEAHVARLALVYALADRSHAIDVDHLEAAIAFADYAAASVIWALGDSTGNRHADVLRKHLADGVDIAYEDARTITGKWGADLEEAIGVLVIAGLATVVKVPRPGGGRPRRVIRSNITNSANHRGAART